MRSCQAAGRGFRCCPSLGAAPPAAPGSARIPCWPNLPPGLALAVLAARASSAWELAALAWLTLLAVPLAFIDVAVHRLPDPLTAAACIGIFALLGVAALTNHQPGHLGRAAIGAAALTCFYLALSAIRPGSMSLGDAQPRGQRRCRPRLDQLAGAAHRYLHRVRLGRHPRRRANGKAQGNPQHSSATRAVILIGALAAIAL
jgi:hypothetical protein